MTSKYDGRPAIDVFDEVYENRRDRGWSHDAAERAAERAVMLSSAPEGAT